MIRKSIKSPAAIKSLQKAHANTVKVQEARQEGLDRRIGVLEAELEKWTRFMKERTGARRKAAEFEANVIKGKLAALQAKK